MTFENTHILITGGNGCVAQETKNWLLQNTNSTIVLLSRRKMEIDAEEQSRVIHISGDIRQGDLILEILNQYKISHLLHTAAIRTTEAQENPAMAFDINVNGTTSLLEAARLYTHLKRFVFISTAAVYGKTGPGSKPDESYPTNASLTYIASKLAAEKIIESYALSYKIQSIVIRPQILFGPSRGSEGSTAGISNAIKSVVKGQPFHISFKGPHALHYTKDVGTLIGNSLMDSSFEDQFKIFNLPGESCSSERFINSLTKQAIKLGYKPELTMKSVEKPFPEDVNASLFNQTFPNLDRTPLDDAITESLIYLAKCDQ